MTKAELVREVSSVTKCPERNAEVSVEAIFERIVQSLSSETKSRSGASAALAFAITRPG
jgi:nucleoid DNA-binding protein